MAIPELNRNIRMKCELSGGRRKHLFWDFLIWCWKQQEKWVEINNLLHPFCLRCKLLRPQHPPDYHSAFISLTFRETLTKVCHKKKNYYFSPGGLLILPLLHTSECVLFLFLSLFPFFIHCLLLKKRVQSRQKRVCLWLCCSQPVTRKAAMSSIACQWCRLAWL